MSGRLYCDKCDEWIIPLHGVTALYERDAWWCAKHCNLTADGRVDFPSSGRLVPETILTGDDDEPIGVKTNFSKQELIDELFRLRAELAMACPPPGQLGKDDGLREFRQLQDENTHLRSLLARWLWCDQSQTERTVRLHAETQAALGEAKELLGRE